MSPARARRFACAAPPARAAARHLDDSAAALPELDALSERDRAWPTSSSPARVKRRGSIDAVLGTLTKAPLEAHDARPCCDALRLTAFQLLFLDRVPAYAAVDDGVALAAQGTRDAGGFANAVLRRVAAEGARALRRRWPPATTTRAWERALLGAALAGEAAARASSATRAAAALLEAANAAAGALPAREPLRGGRAGGAGGAGSRRLHDARRAAACPTALLLRRARRWSARRPFRDGLVTPQSRGSQIAGMVAAGGVPGRARPSWTCAPRPAPRRRSWPRCCPARASPPWTSTRRA